MLNLLVGFYLATIISSIFTTRLFNLLFWYAINSLMLGSIALLNGIKLNDKALLIVGGLTILIKFLIIPYILRYLTLKFKIDRKINPLISIQYLIILVPIVLVFTFYLVIPILQNLTFNANYVAISIASLFLAVILIIAHSNIGAKIVGFLYLENSLFLLEVSATNGMPMVVELGIFVDLMMLILIINLLFKYQGE